MLPPVPSAHGAVAVAEQEAGAGAARAAGAAVAPLAEQSGGWGAVQQGWGAALSSQQTAWGAAGAEEEEEEELRVDPADGCEYTRQDFIDQYAGAPLPCLLPDPLPLVLICFAPAALPQRSPPHESLARTFGAESGLSHQRDGPVARGGGAGGGRGGGGGGRPVAS